MNICKSGLISARTKSLREKFSRNRSYSELSFKESAPTTSSLISTPTESCSGSLSTVNVPNSSFDSSKRSASSHVGHSIGGGGGRNSDTQIATGTSDYFVNEPYCSALDLSAPGGFDEPRFPWQRDAAIQCDLISAPLIINRHSSQTPPSPLPPPQPQAKRSLSSLQQQALKKASSSSSSTGNNKKKTSSSSTSSTASTLINAAAAATLRMTRIGGSDPTSNSGGNRFWRSSLLLPSFNLSSPGSCSHEHSGKNELDVETCDGGGGGLLRRQKSSRWASASVRRPATLKRAASFDSRRGYARLPSSAPDSFDEDSVFSEHPKTKIGVRSSTSTASNNSGDNHDLFNFNTVHRLLNISLSANNSDNVVKPFLLELPDDQTCHQNLPSPNVQSEIQEVNPVLRKLSVLSRAPHKALAARLSDSGSDKKSRSPYLDLDDDDLFIDDDDEDDLEPPSSSEFQPRRRRRALVPPKLITDGYESSNELFDIDGKNCSRPMDSKTQSLTDENDPMKMSDHSGKTMMDRGDDLEMLSKPPSLHTIHHHHQHLMPNVRIESIDPIDSSSSEMGGRPQKKSSAPASTSSSGSGSNHLGVGVTSTRGNRRRSSVVVIPPMQICPGDLLVYSKFDRSTSRNKADAILMGLEEVLHNLQPTNSFVDETMLRYRISLPNAPSGLSRAMQLNMERIRSKNHEARNSFDSIVIEGERETNVKPKLQRAESRRETLWELFQSDLLFLTEHLMVLKNVFMEPLKKIQVEGFAMFAEPEVLFGNLDELCLVTYAFCREFLNTLVSQTTNNELQVVMILSKLFQNSGRAAALTQAYHRYTLNYINALNYLETLRRQIEFTEFEKWCNRDPRCKKLQLTDLLVAPVQHVMRVPLLLKEIESRTHDSNERTIISAIIQEQEHSLRELDDKMRWLKNFERLLEIQRNIMWPSVCDMDPKVYVPEFLKNLLAKQPCERLIVSPRRQIILEGPLMILDSGKAVEMYVFLFDDLLLITRRKKGLGKKQSTLTERFVSNCSGRNSSFSSVTSGGAGGTGNVGAGSVSAGPIAQSTSVNVAGAGAGSSVEPTHGSISGGAGAGSVVGGSLYKYVVYKQPLSLDRFYIHDILPTTEGAANLKNGFVLVCLNRFQQVVTLHTFQAMSETAKNTWLSKLRDTSDRWKRTLQNNVFRKTPPPPSSTTKDGQQQQQQQSQTPQPSTSTHRHGTPGRRSGSSMLHHTRSTRIATESGSNTANPQNPTNANQQQQQRLSTGSMSIASTIRDNASSTYNFDDTLLLTTNSSLTSTSAQII
ncbi:prolactin receptor [Blomia tropicalis]|nr:prolactin receptor [Blomia tropicalis]